MDKDSMKYFALSPHIFYEDEKLKYATFAVINKIQDDSFTPRFRFREETIHCSTDQFYEINKNIMCYLPFFDKMCRLIYEAKGSKECVDSGKTVVKPLNDDGWPSEFAYAAYLPRILMYIETRVNYNFVKDVGVTLQETVQFLPLQIFEDDEKEEYLFGLMYFKTIDKKEVKCRAVMLDKSMITNSDWHELKDKNDYLIAPSPLNEDFMRMYREELSKNSQLEGGLFPSSYYYSNMKEDEQTKESLKQPILILTDRLISFIATFQVTDLSFDSDNFPGVSTYVRALIKGNLDDIKICELVRDTIVLLTKKDYHPKINEFLDNKDEYIDICELLKFIYKEDPLHNKDVLKMIDDLATLTPEQSSVFVERVERYIKTRVDCCSRRVGNTKNYVFNKYFKGGKKHEKN